MSEGLLTLDKLCTKPYVYRADFFPPASDEQIDIFLGGILRIRRATVLVHKSNEGVYTVDLTAGSTARTFDRRTQLLDYVSEKAPMAGYPKVEITENDNTLPSISELAVLSSASSSVRSEVRIVFV